MQSSQSPPQSDVKRIREYSYRECALQRHYDHLSSLKKFEENCLEKLVKTRGRMVTVNSCPRQNDTRAKPSQTKKITQLST